MLDGVADHFGVGVEQGSVGPDDQHAGHGHDPAVAGEVGEHPSFNNPAMTKIRPVRTIIPAATARLAYAIISGISSLQIVNPRWRRPASQPRWYRGSHETMGTHRASHPEPGGWIRRLHPWFQSRMKAMRTSAARSTNGSPLTSTAARWMVPPVKDHGAWPG